LPPSSADPPGGSGFFVLTVDAGTIHDVQLEGWNSIPEGYGAQFDLRGVRGGFGFGSERRSSTGSHVRVAVRRGYGWLSPDQGLSVDELGGVPDGWRIRPDDHESPGSTAFLA
jgi:hypothetical protein